MTFIEIVNLVLLFAPIYVANATPVIFAKNKWLSFLDLPVDLNKRINGRPIFGKNKTYRGFVSGVSLGIIAALLINNILHFFSSNFTALLFGALISFGALFGDLIKSFFKRMIKIDSGKNWIPFDQLDYIFGAIIFSLPIVIFPLSQYIILIIVSFVFHLFGNLLRWIIWRS